MTPPEYTIVRTRPFVCQDESGVQLYGDAPASAANASTIANPPVAKVSAGASRAKSELMFINRASIATPSRPRRSHSLDQRRPRDMGQLAPLSRSTEPPKNQTVRTTPTGTCCRERQLRTGRQHERRPGRLREVEIREQVAEAGCVLPHGRARIRATVELRVESRAPEEVVLDELQIRVEAQHLMVDVALLRVRADHEPGDAQP